VIQNSLERLLEAITETVRHAAEHSVGDRYASAQLAAAAELLDNIAPRVQWSRDALLATTQRARELLRLAVDACEDSGALPAARAALAETVPDVNEKLLAQRDRHLEAVGEVAAWILPADGSPGPREVRAALDSFLREQLEEERRLVRAGGEGVRRSSPRPSEPAPEAPR
jgi:hypothetical protein